MASASARLASRMTVPPTTAAPAADGSGTGQLEPEEVVRAERQEVGEIADAREVDSPDELDRDATAIAREVELHVLREPREVRDAQDRDPLVLAHVREDAPILGMAELERPAAETGVLAADADHPLRPVQQRPRDALLGLDIDG